MLNSIELKNFQSHENTKLELSPGVNALIGPSDNGKTALLRALYWIFTNRPSGESFVSHWAKNDKGELTEDCFAKIVSDSFSISRVRTASENGYDLKIKGEKLQKFRAIGMDLPDVVNQITNVNEINLHRQLDPPFLLSSSSGEVARFFNKIIDLTSIDKILSLFEQTRRKNNQDIKARTVQLSELEEELKKLNWIDEADKLLTKIIRVEQKKKTHEERRELILSTIEEYNDAKNTILTFNVISKSESKIKLWESGNQELRELSKNKRSLSELISDFLSASNKVSKFSALVKYESTTKEWEKLALFLDEHVSKFSTINLQIKEYRENEKFLDELPNLKEMNAWIIKADKEENYLESLRNTREALDDTISNYTNYEKSINVYSQKLEKLYEEMPEVCPLCGAKINSENL